MRLTLASQGGSVPFGLDFHGYHIEVSDMAGSISVSQTDGRVDVSFAGLPEDTAAIPALQAMPEEPAPAAQEISAYAGPEQPETVDAVAEPETVATHGKRRSS